MVVTRPVDSDSRAAELFQAFNRCAHGFTTNQVLNAAANMLVAAIHHHAKANDASMGDAEELARQIGLQIPKDVVRQWNWKARPDDIVVPENGN